VWKKGTRSETKNPRERDESLISASFRLKRGRGEVRKRRLEPHHSRAGKELRGKENERKLVRGGGTQKEKRIRIHHKGLILRIETRGGKLGGKKQAKKAKGKKNGIKSPSMEKFKRGERHVRPEVHKRKTVLAENGGPRPGSSKKKKKINRPPVPLFYLGEKRDS